MFLGVPLANDWNGSRVTNVNTISRNGFFWAEDTATGVPDGVTGVSVIVHWRQSYGTGNYGMQILMGLNTDIMFARQSAGINAWKDWKQIQFVA